MRLGALTTVGVYKTVVRTVPTAHAASAPKREAAGVSSRPPLV